MIYNMRKIGVLIAICCTALCIPFIMGAAPQGHNMGMRSNVNHADFTADNTVIKATPGVFYGISGVAKTVGTYLFISDGNATDTTDLVGRSEEHTSELQSQSNLV